MLDFFAEIGEIFDNIFGFFQGIIDGITGFIESVQSFWDSAMTILSMFPDSLVVIVGSAFGLLIAWIVIDVLRDFL